MYRHRSIATLAKGDKRGEIFNVAIVSTLSDRINIVPYDGPRTYMNDMVFFPPLRVKL